MEPSKFIHIVYDDLNVIIPKSRIQYVEKAGRSQVKIFWERLMWGYRGSSMSNWQNVSDVTVDGTMERVAEILNSDTEFLIDRVQLQKPAQSAPASSSRSAGGISRPPPTPPQPVAAAVAYPSPTPAPSTSATSGGTDTASTSTGTTSEGTEVKLSLKLRKDIRDSVPAMEKHLAAIEKATGIKFTLSVDFGQLLSSLAGHEKYDDYTERLGGIVQDSYLDGLQWNIGSFVSEEILKEQFVKLLSPAATIKFRILPPFSNKHDGPTFYSRTIVENGILFVEIPKDRFWTNTNDCGSDLIYALSTPDADQGLTLTQRRDIASSVEARDKHLQTIKTATGIDFQYEVDFASINSMLPKDCSYRDQIGSVVYNSYLDGLSWHIKNKAADEMVKEALIETCEPSKKIIFQLYEDKDGPYSTLALGGNGELLLKVPATKFAYNTADAGYTLESLF